MTEGIRPQGRRAMGCGAAKRVCQLLVVNNQQVTKSWIVERREDLIMIFCIDRGVLPGSHRLLSSPHEPELGCVLPGCGGPMARYEIGDMHDPGWRMQGE